MKSKIFYGFIFIFLTRAMGLVFLPALLKFSPTLLILLSPFLHHLILTSTLLSPLPFLLIGTTVSLFQCTIGYEFGRRYGTLSFDWCQKHNLISAAKIDLVSRWVRSSAPLVLFLIPGPLIAMVTGVFHLKPKSFFFFMVPSQVLWVSACLLLGTHLESYLFLIKTFIIEHWLLLTLSLLVFKAIKMWLHKVLN
jgi:membrane protein DedA with SNARE-associated domain